MKETTWGILCPGPSLNKYATRRLIEADQPDYKVAVNGAILSGIPGIDFWIVSDAEVFIDCCKLVKADLLNHAVVLWCPERWTTELDGTHPNALDFLSFRKEFFCSHSEEAVLGSLFFTRDINFRESTFLISIAQVIRKGGKDIRVYGADLAGQGYFKPGLENYRTIHTEKRWLDERIKLKRVTDQAQAYGITIIRRFSETEKEGL